MDKRILAFGMITIPPLILLFGAGTALAEYIIMLHEGLDISVMRETLDLAAMLIVIGIMWLVAATVCCGYYFYSRRIDCDIRG